MAPLNKHHESYLDKIVNSTYKLPWDWLYSRCHLIFSFIVFIGMLVFVWWVTS